MKTKLATFAIYILTFAHFYGGSVSPDPSTEIYKEKGKDQSFSATSSKGSVTTSMSVSPDGTSSSSNGDSEEIVTFDTEGKEYTCTLTVDHTGNNDASCVSGKTFDYHVIVPGLDISSTTPSNKIIPNDVTNFYPAIDPDHILFVYVDPTPTDKASTIRQDVDLTMNEAEPNTSDWGTVDSESKNTYKDTGGPFKYTGKFENSSDKDGEMLEDQTITLGAYYKDTELDTETVTVRSGFNFLRYTKSRFDDAIDFVNAKYGVNQSATYNAGLTDYGQTSVGLSVQIGPPAMGEENTLASTLIHERTHVQQGSVQIGFALLGQGYWEEAGGTSQPAASYNSFQRDCISIWANSEYTAYQAENSNFSHTKLSTYDRGVVNTGMDYYGNINYYITHP